MEEMLITGKLYRKEKKRRKEKKIYLENKLFSYIYNNFFEYMRLSIY